MFEPLKAFLEESAPSTDFFCFQEVFNSPECREVSLGRRADILSGFREILPDFEVYYAPVQTRCDGDLMLDFEVAVGVATFVKKGIAIDSEGDILINGERNGVDPENIKRTFPFNLQYLRFQKGGQAYTLANLHGMAFPGSKIDTPERIGQSKKIAEFLTGEKGEKILGGDFNLLPDTKSIRMIEGIGMRNLIKEFEIGSTRSSLSHAQYPEHNRQYFADYVFVSPAVKISRFEVPDIAISDHLPMVLKIVL